MHVLEWDC